jgi:hypothetical protein
MADLPTLCPLDPRLEREIVKRIPEHCREGLLNYLRHGIPPGSFLTAVLSNDLTRAWLHGDDANRAGLADYVSLLYTYAPSTAWGSPYAVREWIQRGAKALADRELTGDEAAQALGAGVARKGQE